MGRLATLVLVLVLAGCGRLGFGDHDVAPDGCAVTVAPAQQRINFNSTRQLEPTGGDAPYHYALTGDGATVGATDGVVTARDQPGQVTVTVTDDRGCSAEARFDVGGDTLWYVGGSSMAVPQAQVYKSTDGATWTLAGSLPDKRNSGALFVFHDQLIYATGTDGVGPKTDVFATTDGMTWTKIGDVPTATANPGFAVWKDKMWLVGGAGASDIKEVFSSDAGTIWTATGSLPELNHGGAVAATADKLWYLGGHNNSTSMLYRWVLSSTDGTFTMAGNLASGREYASAIAIGDTVILAGGQDTTPTSMSSVLTTQNGTTFVTQPPMPVARAFTALVRFGDFIYSIGGNDGGGVVRAPASGGAWTAVTGDFPQPRQGGKAAVFSPVN